MHTIRKTADWVLSAERAPEAPDAMYGVACMMCPAESAWTDNDRTPVELWAIDHTARDGLDHNQFILTTQLHLRVDPRTSAPPTPPDPQDPGPEPDSTVRAVPGAGAYRPQGGTHARPRRWRRLRELLRRAVARAGRAAGGLILVTSARCLPGLATHPGRRHTRQP